MIVPHSGVEKPFRHSADDDLANIIWVAPPRLDHQHRMTVAFVSPSAPADSWAQVLLPTDRYLGMLDLRNGDCVVLHQREIPMVEKERSFVLKFVADMRINYDGPAPEVTGASVVTTGIDDDGYPYILDLTLGWENVSAPASRADTR